MISRKIVDAVRPRSNSDEQRFPIWPILTARRVLADVLQATQSGAADKQSFYAVSIQDRTINPDLERFMAKRMDAKTVEINTSHLALISQPDAITNLIMEALAV
jgi:hypothetical protein